ncbi:MAG: hypothetical protein RLZ18_933 [Actinomycetota bacterium]
MRVVSSRIKAVTAMGAPPGAAFNTLAFIIVMALFIASIEG